MKKILTPFALLFLGTVVATNCAKAQQLPATFPLCIHDEYGYVWSFTVTRDGDSYNGKGTVDIGAGFAWDASGWWDSSTGETSLTASNPQADGCASGYTDYFTYSGSATAGKNAGIVYYDGSGNWASYCSNVQINAGDWAATDCDHKGRVIKKYGPATSAQKPIIKVTPNPVNGNANISYSLRQAGQVNITVYNSMQQVVKVLVNDFKNAGNYSTVWNSKVGNINAGIYRVVAVINGKSYTTTVQVVR